MTITATLTGLDTLLVRIRTYHSDAQTVIQQVVTKQTADLEQAVKDRMASLFKTKTGRMRNSTSFSVQGTPTGAVGTVEASGLPYLRLQEFGGTVHLPDIFPVNAAALHWVSGSGIGYGSRITSLFGSGGSQGDVFAAHVKAHDVTLPERSFMRAALAQQRSAIIAAFQEAFGGTA